MAGTIPLALQQQSDINGNPLAGCLLYIFEVGTTATLQNAYQDFGLTIALPNPIPADQTGRLPMFYLADGQVHVRLTDATGVVIFDYPTMQVIGPSSGGGGGGGSIDPTTIAQTGDWKWRPTSETLTGWVKGNAQTIGSATSGATQRANADTQNLFVYLWQNCPNTHCPVSGGRGASALADFQANKTIGLPDMRSRSPVGLDDMGNAAAGIILASNVTSGNGDGPTTPGAWGGEANHLLSLLEAPRGQFTFNDGRHNHNLYIPGTGNTFGFGGGPNDFCPQGNPGTNWTTSSNSSNCSITDQAGGGAHNNMHPFMVGTWFVKL